jgi:hypothetical protein
MCETNVGACTAASMELTDTDGTCSRTTILCRFLSGGSYETVNLVTACLGCNYLKADYDPRENDEPVTLENRQLLIKKAKDEIERRRSLWQDDFREILRQAGRL